MNVFKDYSKYYDLLYADKDYVGETDFVEKLLLRYSTAKPKSLLELGSGTGKHALNLAQRGYDIEGVDQSQTMLEMAGKLLLEAPAEIAKKVKLYQGDVRTIRLNKKCDAAISLFHVLSYQTTNDDLEATFKTVKEHVNPGGVFIFDCWYGPAALTQKPEVRFKRFHNETLTVERVAVPTLNENDNMIKVHYHLFVQENDNKAYYKMEEEHLMRYLFLPEIENLCAKFGMTVVATTEWMTHKELSTNTWGACFVIIV